MNTLTFRKVSQAAIFECELKGQISDGKWENTPRTGWEDWCRTEVLVGTNIGRHGFVPMKDNFNFADRELVSIVGDRMKNYAKLAMAMPGIELKSIERLADGVCDLHGNFRGIPGHDRDGKYWDDIREWLSLWNMDKVESILKADTYTDKELKADLKEIKATVRTVARDVPLR